MSEGDVWYVSYGELNVLHARLLCSHVQGDLWVIATPDFDVYEELLSNRNPDLVEVHRGGGGFGAAIPAGLNPAHIYGFRAMTIERYQAVMAEARQYAAQLRVQMGLPLPGLAAAAPAVPNVDGVAPDPLVWVSVENDHGKVRGEIICDTGHPLPEGSVTLGANKAIVPFAGGGLFVRQIAKSKISTMEVQDLRVLALDFDEQKSRRVDFAKAVGRMTQDDMPGGGLLLDGPPSTLGVLRSMVLRGLTPVTDHEHWVRTHDIMKGDRSVYEMEVITRTLEAFVMNDQLNVPNLKGCELLMRRWQLIREAHRLSPGAPDYSASDVFMGWEYRRGDGVSPDLAKFVAGELKDQAQIAKGARKAKEELANRKKGGGRGASAAEMK